MHWITGRSSSGTWLATDPAELGEGIDRCTRWPTNAEHACNSTGFETYNPNYIGGDIGGGSFGLKKLMQMGAKRPYALGGGVFLCSAAAPPGAGVHGMCGYFAARAALD